MTYRPRPFDPADHPEANAAGAARKTRSADWLVDWARRSNERIDRKIDELLAKDLTAQVLAFTEREPMEEDDAA